MSEILSGASTSVRVTATAMQNNRPLRGGEARACHGVSNSTQSMKQTNEEFYRLRKQSKSKG